MAHRVVRFPHAGRHGWYVGGDQLIALLPGGEHRWPADWARYSEHQGKTTDELEFADEAQRAEFMGAVGLTAIKPTSLV
jgi:2-polyprenyl-6-methoxyphenol hydroxylase-like FAD-dependent oxidoreductase